MSLQTAIQAAVASTKTATLSLWKDIVYKQIDPSAYNTTTGAVTSTEVTQSLKALVGGYDSDQTGEVFRETDVKFTILIVDFTGTPELTDVITYDGVDYNVISIEKDISESMYVVQGRD